MDISSEKNSHGSEFAISCAQIAAHNIKNNNNQDNCSFLVNETFNQLETSFKLLNNNDFSTCISHFCTPLMNEVESAAFVNAITKDNYMKFSPDLLNVIIQHANESPLPSDQVVEHIHRLKSSLLELNK